MAKAFLEILNLKISVGLFNKYYDDGFVKSLKEHQEILFKKYNISGKTADPELDKKIVGMHQSFNKFFKQHHRIYYLNTYFTPWNIQIRAHEETHILDNLHFLNLLSEKNFFEQKVKINFKKIDEEEVRAQIGSIYAMFAYGFHPMMLENVCYNEDFETAKKYMNNQDFQVQNIKILEILINQIYLFNL